jgi:hypothetical protein
MSLIEFESDGSGWLTDFPFSRRGEGCDPQGSEQISGSFTWSLRQDGNLDIVIQGQRMEVGPDTVFFSVDWEKIVLNLCSDSDDAQGSLVFVGGPDE